MRLHTWEITISTVEDFDEDCARAVVAYFKKKCRYGFVAYECSRKWHLHAAVCFKQPMEKKHFEETIWQKVEKYHPTSKKRMALVSVVQYDHMWRDDYLRKSKDTKVLWDEYKSEDYAKFFPSQEEQDELKLAKETKTMAAKDTKDPRFTRYLQMWTEYSTDETYEGAVKWFKYAMYVEQTIMVIPDKRRLCQLAFALHEMRTKTIEPCHEERRYGMQMVGYSPSHHWDSREYLSRKADDDNKDA